MGSTTNNGEDKISIFKKVYSRHKRKGKHVNRIDDLVSDNEDEHNVVIDITRIRNRVRNRRGEFAFEEEPVLPVESVLPGIQRDRNSIDTAGGRTCSCFAFREFPGVYLYPEALDKELQLRLAYEAVSEYCELGPTTPAGTNDANDDGGGFGSHRTNIDLLPPKAHERVNELGNTAETMWNLWKRDQVLSTQDEDDDNDDDDPPPEKKPRRETHKNNNPKHKNNNYYRRFSKLSWATMGYHYDWTERSYHPQKKSKMPNLVAKLSTVFATASPGLENMFGGSRSSIDSTFTPSASIVNYYTTKSTMGGHRDDLEDPDAMDKPIVSMSLGLPGIFVLGGPTKDEYDVNDSNENENDDKTTVQEEQKLPHPVRALLLRPGDVLVMGGASRLNYHAMARVLPREAAMEYDRRIGHSNMAAHSNTSVAVDNPATSCNGRDHPTVSFANLSCKDLSLEPVEASRPISTWKSHRNDERDYLAEYLRHHRVNINVRQVYPDT